MLKRKKKSTKTIIKAPLGKNPKKRSSCSRRSCSAGCGCLAFVFIGGFVFLAFNARSRTITLKTLPTEISESNLPMYDEDNVSKRQLIEPGKESATIKVFQEKIPVFSSWFKDTDFLHKRRYIFTWEDVFAKPQFVASYYKHAIRNGSFVLIEDWSNETNRLVFENRSGTLRGTLHIRALPEEHTKITYIIDILR